MLTARRLLTSRATINTAVKFFSRSKSGMADYKFDYFFESKVDHGQYKTNEKDYMQILGEDYDI